MKIGIPVLDDTLQEIPSRKTLTYYIDPEVEGDAFAMQTLYTNLKLGYRCALVISRMDPHSIKNNFRELGWELETFPNLSIVDAYSGYVGFPSEEKYFVKDPSDIEQLSETVLKAMEENDLIVFSSLSTIIDLCGEKSLSHIEKWSKHAEENNSSILYSFISWPYPENVLETVKEISNTVIRVGGIHHRVVLGQYYGIFKSDWTQTNNQAILFKLLKPGGIRAYIPKILVTGPFNAGKSSFVKSVSNKSVSVDRLGTTVALDHGHVDYRGFSIDIFGTPGQERFDPLLKVLGEKAMGVILVVDSTDQNCLLRAKEMLSLTAKFGLPYVIAANKQDVDGAMSPDKIREKMNLSVNTPVIPTVATSREGIYEVLDVLLDLLVGEEDG
ncbi:MAG: ADP-ribosylation factor-like protein [Archaeoglobaceae archaeon]